MQEPNTFRTSERTNQLVIELNQAYLNLLKSVADNGMINDPLGPAILGVTEDLLIEVSKIRMSKLQSASRIGLPLVMPRIKDAALFRQALYGGFNTDALLAEITKSFSVLSIAAAGPKGGA